MTLKRKGEVKASAVLIAKHKSLGLFDIATCHCLNLSNLTCPRESKVSECYLDARAASYCYPESAEQKN